MITFPRKTEPLLSSQCLILEPNFERFLILSLFNPGEMAFCNNGVMKKLLFRGANNCSLD